MFPTYFSILTHIAIFNLRTLNWMKCLGFLIDPSGFKWTSQCNISFLFYLCLFLRKRLKTFLKEIQNSPFFFPILLSDICELTSVVVGAKGKGHDKETE
jgi:hypothetical protein